MENSLTIKQFLNGLLLISLAEFLILPMACFAVDLENITKEEIENKLQLPEKEVEKLLYSLINLFHSEWIELAASSYSTLEEMAVPVIMREVMRVQALNHLLIDAPIEVTGKIIKAAVELAKIAFAQDFAYILEKFEKETVRKSIEYGMESLFEGEIRVTPGAIQFRYVARKGDIKEVIFQYIMVYQPINVQRGKLIIRFYSTDYLEPPVNQQSIGGNRGIYTELEHDLPPFIVDIQGVVENYQWIQNPSIKITFPESVPDLGIKPLSFWERQIWKPIIAQIKEIEIIITKVTGRSIKIVEKIENILKIREIAIDIWDKLKSTLSKLSPFGPATIVQTPPVSSTPELEEVQEEITTLKEEIKETETLKEELGRGGPEPPLTLEEIQEMLDDIAERIDIISQKVAKLTGEERKEEKITEEEVEEPEEVAEEELEEEIELTAVQKLCEKLAGSYPLRNKIIINEVAWMGSADSANDEWIELKNISGTYINLTGWQLLDKDNQIKIIFTDRDRVSVNGFYLLERTNDETVPWVTADLIYTGGLSNTNEALYLFDGNCQLQDEVLANPNWPAGDNSSKRTMERKFDLSWQTSFNIGGTPRAENSSGYYEYYGGGVSPPSSPPPKILITEVQIESASNTKDEFVELYNPNDQDVDISQWSIQKSYSTSTTIYKKNFEAGNKIPAKGYFLIIHASSTDQNLLNLADMTHKTFSLSENNTVYLVTNQEKIENASDTDIMDMVGFGENVFSEGNPALNPPAGQSLGRKWSTTTQSYIDTNNNQIDFEIQTPTPKVQNQSPEPQPEPGPAEPLLTVVINEIAWMGTKANSADEWIELYNSSSSDIDIANWSIFGADTGKCLNFSDADGTSTTIISTGGYLIYANREESVKNFADISIVDIWDATIGMNNTSPGQLILYDTPNCQGKVVDVANQPTGNWLAGKASPNYISMERINSTISGATSTNWASNNLITRNGKDAEENNINGTPKAKNSVSISPTLILNLPFDEFDEMTLTYLGSPYIIGILNIPENKILIVEPRVIIKFQPGGEIWVDGTLLANGTTSKEIVFTSIYDEDYGEEGKDFFGDKFWKKIYFSPKSKNSEFKNTLIRYGGRGLYQAPSIAILVEETSIDFKDSTLEMYSVTGMQLINSFSVIENSKFSGNYSGGPLVISGGAPIVKNSTFKKGIVAITISNSRAEIKGNSFEDFIYSEGFIFIENGYPTFEGNSAQNVKISAIFFFGEIKENWQLDNNFIFNSGYLKIGEGVILEIKPGVIIKMPAQGKWEINGALLAIGNEENPIFFTSLYDDEYGGDTNNDGTSTSPFSSGFWDRIYFSPQSQNSFFKNVIISYGGVTPWADSKGEVYVLETKVELENLIVKNAVSSVGLYIENSPETTVSNSHFENLQVAIYIVGECPWLSGLTFTSCVYEVLPEECNF